MRDISHKGTTLRIALAEAHLKMRPESRDMVRDNTGPKPDIPATARAAGYLAVKNTPAAIPHCHPMPVEAVRIDFEYTETGIRILLEAKSIYKTGVEIEAMHGVAVAAMTVYDMLKPVDTDIEIQTIRLVKKTGGKTDWKDKFEHDIRTAIVVCSDSVSAGKKEDRAGKVIQERLGNFPVVAIEHYNVIPDNIEGIRAEVSGLAEAGYDLIITTGGTGLSPTDVTPEAVQPLLEREIPGMMEAARVYGQQRTPYAMLSRSVAGLIGRSLVLCLPGSTKGAAETIDALFPATLHIFKVLEHGYRHGK